MWHACKRRERQQGFGRKPDGMRPNEISKYIQEDNFVKEMRVGTDVGL